MRILKPLRTRLLTTAMLALSMLAPVVASAAVLVEHLDDKDPVTEGWGTVGGGVGVSTGPVTNDLGLGIDAWSVDDPTTNPNSVRFYTFTPSGSEVTQAGTNGWSYEVSLRVVNTPENADRATFADYISDTTRWRMDFGSNLSGDPVVLLQTGLSGVDDSGITYTLVGGGSGYHAYELRYDPLLDSADLFIDGIERVSDFEGMPDTIGGPRVTFGAGQATETGHGHFSLARFTTQPTPPSVPSLSGVALSVLVASLMFGGLSSLCSRRMRA